MAQSRIKPNPEVSRSRLNAAGDLISGRPLRHPMSRDEALEIINNWRSAHSWPLNAIAVTLRDRALRVDKESIVAQRQKRLSSIEAKLRRYPKMALAQMQDIGGCRAVLGDVSEVEELFGLYREANAKNPHRGAEFQKAFDYLTEPKADGYRGIHLVYKYRSRSEHNAAWNGLRIEVQLRSRLQHAWATAVETVSTFTGQQLKSNIGDDAWKRFFVLIATAVAIKENRALVPGAPEDPAQIVRELRALDEELHIEATLGGYQYAVHISDDEVFKGAKMFLLVLDASRQRITVTSYEDGEEEKAAEEYLEAEKEAEINSELNAVLASAESIAALRAAFPNYYLDTTVFRDIVLNLLKSGPF